MGFIYTLGALPRELKRGFLALVMLRFGRAAVTHDMGELREDPLLVSSNFCMAKLISLLPLLAAASRTEKTGSVGASRGLTHDLQQPRAISLLSALGFIGNNSTRIQRTMLDFGRPLVIIS
ncbi:hypothetical protein V8F20_009023 [Naviculisporaceae sp. PSN 640]